MENKLLVKVIMLATENELRNGMQVYAKDGDLIKPTDDWYIKVALESSFKPQHLYFISDAEIKEGDWLYGSNENRIVKAEKTAEWLNQVMDKQNPTWFKIEATTDALLHLPLIREQFIWRYVESQGAIKEVYVEIGDIAPVGHNYVIMGVLSDCGYVVIAKDKNSWSREEVMENIESARKALQWESKEDGIFISEEWLYRSFGLPVPTGLRSNVKKNNL